MLIQTLKIYCIDLTKTYITFSAIIISFVHLQQNTVTLFFFFYKKSFIDEKKCNYFKIFVSSFLYKYYQMDTLCSHI